MRRRILGAGTGPLATELATGMRTGGNAVEQRSIVDVDKAAVTKVVTDAEGAIDTIVHAHQSTQTRTTVVATTTDQWVAMCEDSMTAAAASWDCES